MTYIGTMDVLKARRGYWKAPAKKTGPNDASRVVWAIGESFFILFAFFLFINDVYRYNGCYKGTEGLMEDTGKENGPKRRETRRLGHW
jgi:hypothetical protein